eukprot:8857093-Pyramimonas_sp.AAC.1
MERRSLPCIRASMCMSAMGRRPPSRLVKKTTFVQIWGQQHSASMSSMRSMSRTSPASAKDKSCLGVIWSKPHPD